MSSCLPVMFLSRMKFWLSCDFAVRPYSLISSLMDGKRGSALIFQEERRHKSANCKGGVLHIKAVHKMTLKLKMKCQKLQIKAQA